MFNDYKYLFLIINFKNVMQTLDYLRPWFGGIDTDMILKTVFLQVSLNSYFASM